LRKVYIVAGTLYLLCSTKLEHTHKQNLNSKTLAVKDYIMPTTKRIHSSFFIIEI